MSLKSANTVECLLIFQSELRELPFSLAACTAACARMLGVSSSRSKSAAAHNHDAAPRRRGKAEKRLLPIAVGLWALSLISLVLAFVLGNTGTAAIMSLSFIGGLLLATLADVGAFLTALASAVTYRRHRPWNVVVLIGTVVVSPATLLILLQMILTL